MNEPVRQSLAVPPRLVVGIDPSLAATGISAEVSPDGMLIDECVTTAPGTPRPLRFVHLRDRLRAFIGEHRRQGALCLVAMESEIWTNSPKQAGDASAVQIVYQMALWEMDPQHQWLHYLPVNPSHVKKWLGVQQKDEVLLQVYKRYGREYSNHNLADAYTLARIGRAYGHLVLDQRSDAGWTKPQMEVLAKLKLSGFVWEAPPPPPKSKKARL